MKQTIKLKESELKRMIAESVKRVLNEENTYTDPNGDELDESSIKTEIELLLEHYYGFNEMSKKEVIETLQWLKGMNIDNICLQTEKGYYPEKLYKKIGFKEILEGTFYNIR